MTFSSSCPPIRTPAAGTSDELPADLSSDPQSALSNLTTSFRHKFLFVPQERSGDDYYGVLRASQHPESCESARYLLIEDDLTRAGLGYTARLLAGTLLLAARMRRVLLETPQRNATTGAPFGRWCCVPPYTL